MQLIIAIGVFPFHIVDFTELRMEGARELLKNSDITVDAIAEQCGFGAYTNLYKEFCRAEGCPPLKYRQRNRHGYWDKK